jgi:Holliday junction resolvase
MGASQRTKGAVFERDIATLFSDVFGRVVKRNIGQARDGGDDITMGPLAVECKRRKTMTTMYSWLKQAEKAVTQLDLFGDTPRIPVVVARADNEGAVVVMRLEQFLELAGPEIRRRMDQVDAEALQ